MAPLNRSQLDGQKCSVPGCTHEDHRLLYLHGRCHPGAGNEVAYDMVQGAIIIRCKRCKELVAEIAVERV